jgi:TRAP-type mannitol/chloroaromatic compound transport system permease small subunit
MMKKLVGALDAISEWFGKTAAWLILPVIFVVSYEIVMRYIFHAPTIWAVETMIFGCALIYVFCSAWVSQVGRHVRIDMIYEKLSPRGKATMDSVTSLAFFLYIIMLLWATTKYAYNSVIIFEESDSPWRPPLWPMKVALALGAFLVLLQGAANFIRDLHFAVTGRKL